MENSKKNKPKDYVNLTKRKQYHHVDVFIKDTDEKKLTELQDSVFRSLFETTKDVIVSTVLPGKQSILIKLENKKSTNEILKLIQRQYPKINIVCKPIQVHDIKNSVVRVTRSKIRPCLSGFENYELSFGQRISEYTRGRILW